MTPADAKVLVERPQKGITECESDRDGSSAEGPCHLCDEDRECIACVLALLQRIEELEAEVASVRQEKLESSSAGLRSLLRTAHADLASLRAGIDAALHIADYDDADRIRFIAEREAERRKLVAARARDERAVVF